MSKRKTKSKKRKKPEILHAGRKLLQPLEEQLQTLRDVPVHGNRTLFLDQLVVAHLLAFFNTSVDSLRRIEDVFESRSVRKNLKMSRVPKSTLSDAQRVFDPQLLKPIIDDLKCKMPKIVHDPKLAELVEDLIAVDGTFYTVASRVAWALHGKPNDPDASPSRGAFRVDVHYDLLRGVPEQAVVSNGRLAEQDSLAARIESGKLYITDRAYQAFQLYAEIVAAESDFVVRQRKCALFETVADRPLSDADRVAGVRSDKEVSIPSYRGKPLRGTRLRLVEFVFIDRNDEPCRIRLLTNRLDLPAEIIALLYHYRWQVELFFRWLKCMANLRHFFSESEEGITIQIYVAVIATLMLALKTNAVPNVYDFALIGHVFGGLMPMGEAMETAKRRHREREMAKQRRLKKLGR
ncbi:MAG: IS4 family transposase [bacterium]|nr:IS4 family transposase [bacterium]